jgi:hypothetical protein
MIFSYCSYGVSASIAAPSLKDALALKARLDAKRGAMEALADDAENLHVEHGA